MNLRVACFSCRYLERGKIFLTKLKDFLKSSVDF